MLLDAPAACINGAWEWKTRPERALAVTVVGMKAPMPAEEETLAGRFRRVRATTRALAAPLSPEDAGAQSMPDASPTKWHLAHTTWFFERLVLCRDARYAPPHPDWHLLFNSYYRSISAFHTRSARGLLTRPSLAEVLAWRDVVDEHMTALLGRDATPETAALVTLGLNHEQQHQELLLTDVKHLFSSSPLLPAYRLDLPRGPEASTPALRFIAGPEGFANIGAGDEGFAYDNERPRHRVWLAPHALGDRLVTNAEYRAFIDDGGYRAPLLWLSDGWDTVEREGWTRPLYWAEDLAREFTLAGVRPIDPHAPVCHLSFYEADAYARWAGARLPREDEWEALASTRPLEGNLLDSGRLHPAAGGGCGLFGDVWEWTASAYLGYPGFKPLDGSLGEYNGKFMSGQLVLRGGSCATPADHLRVSYRNFFPPTARWQFTGLRLAKDA